MDKPMNVLIATDGSICAERAIQLAVAIDWPSGTELHVLTVIEPLEPIIAAEWVMSGSSIHDRDTAEIDSRAKHLLERASSALAMTGRQVHRLYLEGRPATRILQKANEIGADLIVVGSRGHGTIASMVLGSVSGEVADHAPCPVLVARGSQISHVLLAHDGSPFARAAEDVIATLPMFDRLPVEVVSVAKVTPPWTSGLALSTYDPPEYFTANSAAAIIGDYRAVAEAAETRLREAGIRAGAHVVEGEAAPTLIKLANETQADLIVIGTHGRTGLTRMVLGSVARNVMLHAGCSVLIVRKLDRVAEERSAA